MAFKSPTQPYCRWCGKPIAKRTTNIYFGRSNNLATDSICNRPEKPTSKAEVQRLINQQVVSVRWRDKPRGYADDGPPERDYIWWAGVWDGESYEDEYFDRNQCAQDMGRSAVKHHNLVTARWRTVTGQE
jgi:hypothetical protein